MWQAVEACSMAALGVRCKLCGAEMATGIRTGWVPRPVLGAQALPCGACGSIAVYHGADFHPLAGTAG